MKIRKMRGMVRKRTQMRGEVRVEKEDRRVRRIILEKVWEEREERGGRKD